MSQANWKNNVLSAAYWFGILYALAACINMREELLTLQAALPSVKASLLSSIATTVRFFAA
jgi:hypothetical protein